MAKRLHQERKTERNAIIGAICSQFRGGYPRWPLDYVAALNGLSRARVSQICRNAGLNRLEKRRGIRSHKIEMTPVTSSNIAKAGYDPASKTFKIEFLSGGAYLHHDVPQSVYDEWVAADSKGSHYHANIKRFRHTKV